MDIKSDKILQFPKAHQARNRKKFLQRLNSCFRPRFGVEIFYLSRNELSVSALAKIRKNPLLHIESDSGKKIYLGVFSGEDPIGALVIHHPTRLDTLDENKLIAILDQIAAPYFQSLDKLQQLKREENQINSMGNPDRTNIIPMFPGAFSESPNRFGDVSVFFIHETDKELVLRKAIDIHSGTENLCFLSFSDLDPVSRLLPRTYAELDQTTLLLGDVSRWQKEDLFGILRFLQETAPRTNSIDFIIASSISPDELVEQLGLSSEEIDAITGKLTTIH